MTDTADIPAAPAPQLKRVSTPKLFTLAAGQFSRAILTGLMVTYILKFFNVTEASGLPQLLPYVGLIGVLRSLDIVFDALIDPWIAARSDNCRSRLGRRIPFMRWAALPFALTSLLIFVPPVPGASWVNAVWIIVMLLAYSLSSSFYLIPLFALEAEIVTDTRRRVFYYTLQSLNYVVGSAIIFVLPLIVSVLRSVGIDALVAWQLSFTFFAVLGAIAALIPAFGIRERDYVKPQSSYLPLFKSMMATFRIKHFRALMWPFLIMQIAFAFFNTAMLFYIDTLLGLNEGFATIVLGLSIVIGIATYPLVNFLAHRFGKKPPLLFACGCYFFIYLGIYFCVPIATALGSDPVSVGPLAVLSPLAGPGATSGEVLFALALGVAIAFPIACTNILPLASFADIAQYDEILSGINKSGMFMAVRTFLVSLSNAVIVAVIGWMMYVGAPNPEYPTFFGVQLTALVAAVTVLAAMLLYARYNDPLVVATINQHKAVERAQGSEAA